MSTVPEQLQKISTRATELEALDNAEVKSHLKELVQQFRNMMKLKSEVDLMNNEKMSSDCVQLVHRVRRLRDIAKGKENVPPLVDVVCDLRLYDCASTVQLCSLAQIHLRHHPNLRLRKSTLEKFCSTLPEVLSWQ